MSSRSLPQEDFIQHPRLWIQATYFNINIWFLYLCSNFDFFYSRWKQPTVRIIRNKKKVCMMLMENHDRIFMMNVSLYNCLVYLFPWKLLSQPQTDSVREWRKQVANRKLRKKLLQGKIFQIYCWPTDTIPYLMGL